MAFDRETFTAPASKADVAGPAIVINLALLEIADVLGLIANGSKPTTEQIAKIVEQADRLSKIFNELTGYHP